MLLIRLSHQHMVKLHCGCDRQEVHDAVLGVGFRVLGVKVWFLEEVII